MDLCYCFWTGAAPGQPPAASNRVESTVLVIISNVTTLFKPPSFLNLPEI